MRMKLLGTAGGDFPRLDDPEDNFAYLPRVRSMGGRNLRTAAQSILYPDTLIDFYSGRQLEAFDIAPDSIQHLVVTHAHWDHMRPLKIMEFARALPHPLQIYGNSSVIEALQFAQTYEFDRTTGRFVLRTGQANLEYHVLEAERSVRVGDTEVHAVLGNHGIDKLQHMILEKPCLNYVFERDGRTVFYGLDSSYTLPRTLEYLSRFRLDAAVLDATFGQWPIDPVKSGHHNLEMLTETISEFRQAGIVDDSTKLVASHIALAQVLPHDDLVGEFEREGMILAYDGMDIDVG